MHLVRASRVRHLCALTCRARSLQPQQREVRAFRIRKSEGVSHLRAADMLWDMMWDETAPTASVN